MHNSTVWLDQWNRIFAIYYYKKNRTSYRLFFEKNFPLTVGELTSRSRSTTEYKIKSLYEGMNC